MDIKEDFKGIKAGRGTDAKNFRTALTLRFLLCLGRVAVP